MNLRSTAPALAGIAPRSVPWENELQVFAANQNEYPYTLSWKGPFYGGFSHVIETFVRTGSPRRLKPVNIYFHFYSGSGAESLGALVNAFAWAAEQPLCAVEAAQYARMVKDSRATRVISTGNGAWSIFSKGDIRTFRLPAKGPVPDLSLSRGVLGWRKEGDSLYVLTDGSPRIDLKLSANPPPRLFVESCSGQLKITRLDENSAAFSVSDQREILLTFAGLKPSAECRMRLEKGAWQPQKASAEGKVALRLPKLANGEFSILSRDE